MSIKKNFFAPSSKGLGATRRAAMLLLVMMLTTATAWAQTTITLTTPSQDGDGYYLIGTAAELYGFAELVNNGNATANAKLTADIVVNENVLDANGEANTGDFVQWTPIGNDYFEDKVYSGTFDGQGHTISGLYVSGNGWFVGFVGQVSGTAVVKNLGIVDSYFSSSNNNLGSIVGCVAEKSSVTIANVYSTSTVKGDNWIGGLVGGDGNGSVSVVNSYFAGKTSANFQSGAYNSHHDDLVAGDFNRSTLTVCNAFVLGTSQYGTSVTAGQLSDGTVAAALHYYQDALADGSMFGLSGGKTNFSGKIDGVSVTTANITLHTFDGDATAYSSKYIVGNTTPLPVNVVREGYTFLGWYDNADFEGDAVTQISSSATGDKEYWAKFERSHSVTFVLNDGYIQTGEIDHYIEGETTALPTMVFKDGASFEGWYTTEDFTGNRYYFIPATATEDMTFYAKWGAEKTTFYLGQGRPEPVSILYEGENMVWLDETTMESYAISDNYGNLWGSDSGINVPYTGGESTFGNNASEFSVAQSGFYVFTLTDKGDGNWFVSVLKSMLNCDVASIPTQVYTGSAIEPVVTVKDGETPLTLGTDYEVAYSNNVNAGTATVTITGKGNYSGEKAATFTIVPKLVTNDGITITIQSQPWTGNELTPVITVKDGETVLTLDEDYTVTAPSGTVQNAGNYTYTITGAGNYSGETTATFTITVPTFVEYTITDATGTDAQGTLGFYSDEGCSTAISAAEEGATVYIKSTPNTGYELNSITTQKTVPSDAAESRRNTSADAEIALGGEVAVTAVDAENGIYQLTMPSSNVTVEATFTPITYSIEYELVGGTVATANPTEYTVESTPITLNNPTLEGYTFGGWTGSNGNTPQTEVTIATSTTGNLSYKAVWYTKAAVRVVWNDMNDHDGIRPVSVTATLSDGTEVTLSSSNSWTATVENLPKNSAGVEIAYTWSVDTPEGYTIASATENGVTTLTFSYTPTVAFAFGADQTWMTWCGSEAYALPTGLEAYTVSGLSEDGTNVVLAPATTIPANTPLLLKGTAGETYNATLTTAGTATGLVNTTIENVLTFYGNPTDAVITTGNYCVLDKSYVLHKGAFVLVDTDNGIPAHKCLLTLSSAVTARLSLVTDGATGIATTPGPSSPEEGKWYDLQGRKLSGEPVKHGIYIFNGEKVKK